MKGCRPPRCGSFARRAAFPAPVHSDDDVCRWFAEEVLPSQEVSVAELDGSVVGVLALDLGWVTHHWTR